MPNLINLSNIIDYIEGGMRCLKEGEAVFNAGHVVVCGVNNQNQQEIVGLCLQTSNLKGPPHSVKVNLCSAVPKEWICTCSCKAGAGGKCKHIIACLLFLYRNDLELLSCTDLEQAWGQRRKTLNVQDVQPVEEFCHVKKRKTSCNISDEVIESTVKELLCGAPNSEAAVHQRQRCKPLLLHAVPAKETVDPDENIVRNSLSLNLNFKLQWNLPPEVVLNSAQWQYFNNNVNISVEEALNIAIATIGQSNDLWRQVRQCRITASRCYELYTYCSNKNPNWEKKINSYIMPTFKGNKYTEHGCKYEAAARATYERQFGKTFQTGVIINPLIPWLACSPDGLKLYGRHFYRLLEIKCPFMGSQKSIDEIVNTLPFLKYDETKPFPYFLNPKHKYYSQVQLNMAVLNLQLCDFVLYSSCNSKIFVIEVKRDEPFIASLINKLHFVYFNFFLPKLVSLQ